MPNKTSLSKSQKKATPKKTKRTKRNYNEKLIISLILTAVILIPTIVFTSILLLSNNDRPNTNFDTSTDYGWFQKFRSEQYAPKTESLIKQTFGSKLQFRNEQDSDWIHQSYYSVAIGFSTNLPTITRIEYGTTKNYGKKTQFQDSHYYNHLHYLKGLIPDTTYYYKITAKDQDKRSTKKTGTFKTAALHDDIIRIPEDMTTQAPYNLNKQGATYLLTKDISVDDSALFVSANNITIDLGGNTITYDNASGDVSEKKYGIYFDWHKTQTKILNGTLMQGKRGSKKSAPMHGAHAKAAEIAGIVFDYYGDDNHGIEYYLDCESLHHNVLLDKGTHITDRHQGVNAFEGVMGTVAWNSLRRFRNWGIRGGAEVYENELYSDSYATNSFMIAPAKNAYVHNNKLFGVGFNPIGIGWADGLHTDNNFIYLHATANRQRSEEYTRLSGVAGIRFTIYDSTETHASYPFTMLHENNTIIAKAHEKGSLARGIWTSTGRYDLDIEFKNNTVKVEATANDLWETHRFQQTIACVDINGGVSKDDVPLTYFTDNTFISNIQFISFGSSYGSGGSNAYFNRTHFVKLDNFDESYQAFTVGYWNWNSTRNFVMNSTTDNVNIENGVLFYGYGVSDLNIGVTVNGTDVIKTRFYISEVGDTMQREDF